MKGYPRWFSAYSKPCAPTKPRPPSETLTEFSWNTVSRPHEVTLGALVEKYGPDANPLVHHERDGYDEYDCDFRLRIGSPTNSVNPNYDKEMVGYEKAITAYKVKYTEYKERLAEWKILKVKYDAEQKTRREKKEIAELERLRKKYER